MNKIDFMVTVEVRKANPNGDPLAGNAPRTDVMGIGEISDVCIKRKIRNRWQDNGQEIFVKSTERADDGFTSLEKRYKEFFSDEKDLEKIYKESCERWLDVRAFGQVFTFKKDLSLGIRGPVSISIARSLSPVNDYSMQITRSTNGVEPTKGSRSSDTMGSKTLIDYGVYLIKGSINTFFAEKTGFNDKDVEVLKEALRTLFVNDASTARPEGSMEVKEIFWFTHSSPYGVCSTAKVHQLLEYNEVDSMDPNIKYENYNIRINEEAFNKYKEKGLQLEIIPGY